MLVLLETSVILSRCSNLNLGVVKVLREGIIKGDLYDNVFKILIYLDINNSLILLNIYVLKFPLL